MTENERIQRVLLGGLLAIQRQLMNGLPADRVTNMIVCVTDCAARDLDIDLTSVSQCERLIGTNRKGEHD